MEGIRVYVRERLGYRSSGYVFLSKLVNYFYAFLKGGVAGVRLVSQRDSSGSGKWVKLRSLELPIFIRPVSEDVSSVVNNIFREEYGQISKNFMPNFIVDAGAYIGDTSAYFLSRYPDAKIVALEPNFESHEMASRNLSGYGERVHLINAALTPRDGGVRISGATTGAKVSDQGIDVPGISIPTLLAESGLVTIDILKMDIEGYELPVLTEHSDEWLACVKWLLLETHGKHIENQLLSFLVEKGFMITRHRNVWYCKNNALGN